ncbi:hypothetical protein EC973_004341 [Apophysomyces ossiformis]|uniref:Uncharacterized protein n=1 Tax=Apophysomyces ossiformis TaxID=679940 RepID=A0A8H7BEQ7_9FUNG|nr:hypothetical protein EC973_004341 [Apophysomyces ossiformis]
MPTADDYTRRYIAATLIVWATTFTLFALFFPQIRALIKNEPIKRTRPVQQRPFDQGYAATTTLGGDLMSLNRMISHHDPLREHSQPSAKDNTLIQAHEEKSHTGHVFGYTHASVVNSSRDKYIFKVHGVHCWDLVVQVATKQDLENWCGWFNSNPEVYYSSSSRTFLTSNTCITTRSYYSGPQKKLKENVKDTDTQNQLLLEGDESGITLETLDSCANAPIVTELPHQFSCPLPRVSEHTEFE